jgi:hypothetical protein
MYSTFNSAFNSESIGLLLRQFPLFDPSCTQLDSKLFKFVCVKSDSP